MALPKIDECRSLSDQELTGCHCRNQAGAVPAAFSEGPPASSTKKCISSKHARHRLAQLMTVQRERELEAAEVETEAASSSGQHHRQAKNRKKHRSKGDRKHQMAVKERVGVVVSDKMDKTVVVRC